MRWYVDINAIGSQNPTQRHCVDAEQWQKALQSVRARRGDEAPFGNFSIELLDDGYRAIDPMTRTRYVVQRAPDDAEVTNEPVAIAPAAPPAAAERASTRPRPSARGRAKSPSIPDDPVPRSPEKPSAPPPPKPEPIAPAPSPSGDGPPTRPATPAAVSARQQSSPPSGSGLKPPTSSRPAAAAAAPASQPVKPSSSPKSASSGSGLQSVSSTPSKSSAPAKLPSTGPAQDRSNGSPSTPPQPSQPPIVVPRPMQAETAFEKMTGGIAVPLPAKVSPTADVPTEVLPAFKVLSRRNEDPTPSSPLTYREMALMVAETTALRDAEAIARAQFEVLRNSLAGAPKGKFIQLAVFDHEFTTKPKKAPVVTLAFKDWRDAEPELRFPLRDGPNAPPAPKKASPPEQAAAHTPSQVPSSQVGRPAIPPPPEVPSPPAASEAQLASPPAEAIRPAPVISITEEPARPRSVPPPPRPPQELDDDDIEVDALEPEPAPPAPAPAPAIPPPTPSEIRRSASDMVGDDEHTLVKPSNPPPPNDDILVEAPANLAAMKTQRLPSVPPPAPPPADVAAIPAAPRPASIPPPNNLPGSSARPASIPPPNNTIPMAAQPPPASSVPPAPPAPPAPAPVSEPPVVSRPGPAISVQPIASLSQAAPLSSKPPKAGLILKSLPGPRKGGDDLLTDLFEATSDLHFVRDPLEAAEFVLDLVYESIPSILSLVSFFDINAREFVVVRQAMVATEGEGLPVILLSRASEFTELIASTMRARRTRILYPPETDVLDRDPRWLALDFKPTSFACVPVISGGRFLGLIEAANPVDGAPFSEADGHALTYIGEQFAEYLAQRELIFDAESVLKPKLAHLARR